MTRGRPAGAKFVANAICPNGRRCGEQDVLMAAKVNTELVAILQMG
jgi:hypothetical protein